MQRKNFQDQRPVTEDVVFGLPLLLPLLQAFLQLTVKQTSGGFIINSIIFMCITVIG